MTVLLLDFFGTLVDYTHGRTGDGYHRSHALVPQLPYEKYMDLVESTFAALEQSPDDTEFSMREAAEAILATAGSAADPADFERVYLGEWQAGVTALPGLPALLRTLRGRHRLAIVSNTHSPAMIPDYLASWGVAGLFDTVVLSVGVGKRKPHPLIYRTALELLDCAPADAVFVGDSYVADYAGPAALGIAALLIDPAGTADVPPARRITSVFDLPGTL
jgi:putative hydrolase of the HAD superfamily